MRVRAHDISLALGFRFFIFLTRHIPRRFVR